MKFKMLTISKGIFSKKFEFNKNYNLIFSDKNSRGKTTLIRFLLYALGYAIPPTKGIKNFSKFDIELFMETKDEKIKLKRYSNYLKVTNIDSNEEKAYTLPVEHSEFLKRIYSTGNIDIVNNVLGAFYFDQEKGWTLLNRGTVIGKINFNIEDLIRGLSNKDCSKLKEELKSIEKEYHKYDTMFELSKYQEEVRKSNIVVTTDSYNEELNKKLEYMLFNKSCILNEVDEISKIIDDNESLVEFLESYKITVQNEDGIEIPVNKHTIKGFQDTIEYSVTRKVLKLNELSEVNKEINELNEKRKKTDMLVDLKTKAQIFDEKVIGVDIDQLAVKTIKDQLNKKKKEIRNSIKKQTKINNKVIEEIFHTVSNYSKELELSEYIDEKTDYIFTSDLKSLSGAVLHKLVFAFKMAYVKSIYNNLGVKLPIILDSPKGKEVDEDNIKLMFDILKKDFKEHQIIVASIYKDYELDDKTIIKINESLMSDAELL